MECFVAFIVMLVTVTVLISLSARSQSRGSRRNLVARQIAQRFHGTCQPGGLFSQPSVRFRHGQSGIRLELATGSRAQPAASQLQFPWFDPGLRCEIVSDAEFPGIHGGGGSLDHLPLRRSATTFDAVFQVRAADADEARRMLSDGVRWQLQRLRAFKNNGPLLVRLDQGRLLVRKFADLQHYGEIEQFVCLGLELFDQMLLTRSVGIEFLEFEEAQVLKDVRCQVCGDEIASDLVFCRRCKTPHHLECWQYTGACSTFGCQEKVFDVPQVARTVESRPSEQQDEVNGTK